MRIFMIVAFIFLMSACSSGSDNNNSSDMTDTNPSNTWDNNYWGEMQWD